MAAVFTDVRVFFEKRGVAKYISHLDLYRAFSRAVKRAGVPVWITEGFNPHIYLTFALPLALGIESREESADLRLLPGECGFDEFAERLGAVMPPGLRVLRAAAPVADANTISRAKYRVRTSAPDVLRERIAADSVIITKKTKKNVREIDVKPLMDWDGDVMTLPAGNTLNINPWNVLEGVAGEFAVERVAVLCADGAEFR